MGKNFVTKELNCDNRIGFKVKLHGDYLKTTKGHDRVFCNLELAKVTAYAKGAKSALDFDIDFFVYKNKIPFEYIQEVNGKLEFFGDTKEGLQRFVINQEYITEYNNFGYIVFDNGDTNRMKADKGEKRNRLLRNRLLRSVEKLAHKYGLVDDIFLYDNNIIVSFSKTTSKLNIMTNSDIIEINQWRKTIETDNIAYRACYPFNPKMDKYTTFYTFTSKDLYESTLGDSKVYLAKNFRDLIMDDLMEDEELTIEPKFVSVSNRTNGKILGTRK